MKSAIAEYMTEVPEAVGRALRFRKDVADYVLEAANNPHVVPYHRQAQRNLQFITDSGLAFAVLPLRGKDTAIDLKDVSRVALASLDINRPSERTQFTQVAGETSDSLLFRGLLDDPQLSEITRDGILIHYLQPQSRTYIPGTALELQRLDNAVQQAIY